MDNVKFTPKKLTIILVIFVLIILVWNHFSLPEFLVTEARVEWQGRNYEIDGNVKRWVLGKPIAEDSSGHRLYALKGDRNKGYHAVVVDAQMLYVEYGYEIPREGDVTGIIAEYTTNPGDARNFTYQNRFFKKKYLEEIIDKALSFENFEKFEKEIYIDDNKFYRIHLCFNDCPVAGKCIGFVGEMGGEIYLLLGDDVIVGPSGTKEYKAYIKSFTQYCILNSENAQKEFKELKTQFKH